MLEWRLVGTKHVQSGKARRSGGSSKGYQIYAHLLNTMGSITRRMSSKPEHRESSSHPSSIQKRISLHLKPPLARIVQKSNTPAYSIFTPSSPVDRLLEMRLRDMMAHSRLIALEQSTDGTL